MIGVPRDSLFVADVADPAAPHEERIAKAVKVLNGFGRNRFQTGQGDGDPLGAAADCAALVQQSVENAAAGQDEGTKRGQVMARAVDFLFEMVTVARVTQAGLICRSSGGAARMELRSNNSCWTRSRIGARGYTLPLRSLISSARARAAPTKAFSSSKTP